MVTKHCFDGAGFGHVVEWGTRAVGIDVINGEGIDARFADGHFHGPRRTGTIVTRGNHVFGIVAITIPNHLGDDRGTTAQGMLEFFEDDGTGAFGQYEAVTAGVEWFAGRGGVFVVTSQTTHIGKRRHNYGYNRRFGTASNNHVGVITADGFECFADVVATRRTGRHDCHVGTKSAGLDGDVARRRIVNHVGNEGGGDTPRPFVTQDFDIVANQIDTTGTGAVNHAEAFAVHGGGVELSVAERFEAGIEGIAHIL